MSESTSVGIERALGIVGLPVGYNFGIDMRMWEIGEKFTGIRNIPPGLHYVYYSDPQDEVRQGFFLTIFADTRIVLRKWDPSVESLIPVASPSEKHNMELTFMHDFRYISGLAPFDKCISDDAVGEWSKASQFITQSVIERIQPINCLPFTSQQQKSVDLAHHVPTIFWTDLAKVKLPMGASGAELTQHSVDSSLRLEQILESTQSSDQLLLVGELQAAFVLFLLGLNYDAFMQWRRLLDVFLHCREAGILRHAELFTAFCNALVFQVKQLPDDFLFDSGMTDDDVPHSRRSKSVFILPWLSEFVLTCTEESLLVDPELTNAVGELDRAMHDRYGNEWTGDFAPEEDGPQIVHL